MPHNQTTRPLPLDHGLLLDILLVWPTHIPHNRHRSLPTLHWYVFWVGNSEISTDDTVP
jgi:hypothetical protein